MAPPVGVQKLLARAYIVTYIKSMSVTLLEKIRQEAESLTPDEKLSLAEHLWSSLPEDPEIEKAWLEEVQRRSNDIDAGTAKLTPWRELQAELKSHLENNHNRR